jgi:hypothetical protein
VETAFERECVDIGVVGEFVYSVELLSPEVALSWIVVFAYEHVMNELFAVVGAVFGLDP